MSSLGLVDHLEGEHSIVEQLRREEKQGNLNHSQHDEINNFSRTSVKKKTEQQGKRQQMNSHQKNIDSTDALQLIFQATNDLVLFLDKTGKITKINNAGIAFSGFTEKEIIGKHFWKIPGVFSKKNVANYLKVFKNSLMGKKTEHFVATLNDKNG
ncbi:MAG: PAS domain S-box protein, partial [Thermoplasmatota archaeon]